MSVLYHIIGNAMRHCDDEGQWMKPNVLQCTSIEFIKLEDSVGLAVNGITLFETVNYCMDTVYLNFRQRVFYLPLVLKNKSSRV